MPSAVYVRNVCLRIPGSSTRSTVGPIIILGLLETIWSPVLADEDDLDAGSGIEVIEGNFGITKIYDQRMFQRQLRKQWMRTRPDGTPRDIVAETYPGNTFNVAFRDMLQRYTVPLEKAIEIEKEAATRSNFVPMSIDPVWEQMLSESIKDKQKSDAQAKEPGLPDDDDDEPLDGSETLDSVEVAKQVTNQGGPEDLTKIKGVGPVLERNLRAAGYTTVASVAEADPEELAEEVEDIGAESAVSVCHSASILLAQRLVDMNNEE